MRAPALFLALLTATAAGAGWRLDVSGGSAWNAVTPLVIHQQGQDPLWLAAQYSTRPLADVPYYAVRIGRGGQARWEFELVHHKLYLDNLPPEIERFQVTHGFNLLSLGRSWPAGPLELRFGTGPMLTHPENTVRGRVFDEGRGILGTGWYISGAGFQFGAGRRWRLGRVVELVVEGKATAAWTEVPIVAGRAELPNAALHGLIGLGFRL
ncbi:MAG: hypothetical protein R6X14_10240 [bacterium]